MSNAAREQPSDTDQPTTLWQYLRLVGRTAIAAAMDCIGRPRELAFTLLAAALAFVALVFILPLDQAAQRLGEAIVYVVCAAITAIAYLLFFLFLAPWRLHQRQASLLSHVQRDQGTRVDTESELRRLMPLLSDEIYKQISYHAIANPERTYLDGTLSFLRDQRAESSYRGLFVALQDLSLAYARAASHRPTNSGNRIGMMMDFVPNYSREARRAIAAIAAFLGEPVLAVTLAIEATPIYAKDAGKLIILLPRVELASEMSRSCLLSIRLRVTKPDGTSVSMDSMRTQDYSKYASALRIEWPEEENLSSGVNMPARLSGRMAIAGAMMFSLPARTLSELGPSELGGADGALRVAITDYRFTQAGERGDICAISLPPSSEWSLAEIF